MFHIHSCNQVIGPSRSGSRYGLWRGVPKHLRGNLGHDHYIRYLSERTEIGAVMQAATAF
jgi:hypothetical protein